jgi:hypothetical protein
MLASSGQENGEQPRAARLSIPLDDARVVSIELPGIRPGTLRALPEMWPFPFQKEDHPYILWNGFPFQPGITPFGLSRTWVCYATPKDKFVRDLESEKQLASVEGKSGSGKAVSCKVFASSLWGVPLEQLNAEPLLDAGHKRLEFPPAIFALSIKQGQASTTLILIGSPIDKEYKQFTQAMVDSVELHEGEKK